MHGRLSEHGFISTGGDTDRLSVAGTTPVRGVFQRGDAWLDTGDLFVVEDGDYWCSYTDRR